MVGWNVNLSPCYLTFRLHLVASSLVLSLLPSDSYFRLPLHRIFGLTRRAITWWTSRELSLEEGRSTPILWMEVSLKTGRLMEIAGSVGFFVLGHNSEYLLNIRRAIRRVRGAQRRSSIYQSSRDGETRLRTESFGSSRPWRMVISLALIQRSDAWRTNVDSALDNSSGQSRLVQSFPKTG